MFEIFFKKGKIIKAPAGFEHMTYRFAVNAPTHCATLFSAKPGKEKNL